MYNTSDNKYQFSTISKGVIEKMLIKLDNIKDIKYILEPSACKGNLVKMIKNSYKYDLLCREIFIDTIEKNPQFKLILNNLNVPVIHDDFLTFNTLKKYDAIIMNPPLNNGEEYLLKAIEIQESVVSVFEEAIPLENRGRGMENLIKTKIALERNSKVDVILIEEPENHLSFSTLNKMLNEVSRNKDSSQIILTTHRSC